MVPIAPWLWRGLTRTARSRRSNDPPTSAANTTKRARPPSPKSSGHVSSFLLHALCSAPSSWLAAFLEAVPSRESGDKRRVHCKQCTSPQSPAIRNHFQPPPVESGELSEVHRPTRPHIPKGKTSSQHPHTLHGGGQKFQVSGFRFQDFKISRFQDFKISRFQSSGCKFQVSGFRFQVTGFMFQGSTFRFFRFQVFLDSSYCGFGFFRFQISQVSGFSYFRFFRFHVSNFNVEISDRRSQVSGFRFQVVGCRLQF